MYGGSLPCRRAKPDVSRNVISLETEPQETLAIWPYSARAAAIRTRCMLGEKIALSQLYIVRARGSSGTQFRTLQNSTLSTWPWLSLGRTVREPRPTCQAWSACPHDHAPGQTVRHVIEDISRTVSHGWQSRSPLAAALHATSRVGACKIIDHLEVPLNLNAKWALTNGVSTSGSQYLVTLRAADTGVK
jgi:hypothetical protein